MHPCTDGGGSALNLGCFYAIGGDSDEAFTCLNRAVDLGFAHREWMENDLDMESLYGDPRWRQLLERFGSRGNS